MEALEYQAEDWGAEFVFAELWNVIEGFWPEGQFWLSDNIVES